jgi:prepilin-type N-terminal cleavage/methylation domain-containing protein
MRRRGMTLVELLMGAVALSVLMVGLLQAVISLFSSFHFALGMNQTVVDAGNTANEIAGAIRRSSVCEPRLGCLSSPGSAILKGTSSSISLFRDSRGDSVTYENKLGQIVWKSGQEESVLADDGALSIRYYRSDRYNASELVEFTPSPATLKNTIAIQLSVTVTGNGVTDTHTTVVRLRNSPANILL